MVHDNNLEKHVDKNIFSIYESKQHWPNLKYKTNWRACIKTIKRLEIKSALSALGKMLWIYPLVVKGKALLLLQVPFAKWICEALFHIISANISSSDKIWLPEGTSKW